MNEVNLSSVVLYHILKNNELFSYTKNINEMTQIDEKNKNSDDNSIKPWYPYNNTFTIAGGPPEFKNIKNDKRTDLKYKELNKKLLLSYGLSNENIDRLYIILPMYATGLHELMNDIQMQLEKNGIEAYDVNLNTNNNNNNNNNTNTNNNNNNGGYKFIAQLWKLIIFLLENDETSDYFLRIGICNKEATNRLKLMHLSTECQINEIEEKHHKIETDNEQLRIKVKQLLQEIDHYNNEKETINSSYNKFVHETEDIQRNIDNINKQLYDNLHIQKMNKFHLNMLKEDLYQYNCKYNKIDDQHQHWNNTVNEIQDKHSQYSVDKANAKSVLSLMKKSFQDKEDDLLRIKNESSRLKNEYDDRIKLLNQLKIDLQQYRNNVHELNLKNNDIQSQLRTIQSKFQFTKGVHKRKFNRHQLHNKTSEDQKTKITELNDAITTYKNRIIKSNEKIKDLMEQSTNYSQDNVKISRNIRSLKAKLRHYKRELQKTKEENRNLKDIEEKLLNDINLNEKLRDRQLFTNKTLLNDQSDLKIKLTKIREQIKTTRDANDRVVNDTNNIKNEIEHNKNLFIDQYNSQLKILKSLQKNCAKLSSELHIVNRQLILSKKRLQKHTIERNDYNEMITNIRNDIDENRKYIYELEQETLKLTEESNKLEKRSQIYDIKMKSLKQIQIEEEEIKKDTLEQLQIMKENYNEKEAELKKYLKSLENESTNLDVLKKEEEKKYFHLLEEEKKKLMIEVDKIRHEIIDLEKDCNIYQSQNSDVRRRGRLISTKLPSWKQQNTIIRTDLRRLENRYLSLSNSVKEIDVTAERVRKEIDEKLASLSNVDKEINQLNFIIKNEVEPTIEERENTLKVLEDEGVELLKYVESIPTENIDMIDNETQTYFQFNNTGVQTPISMMFSSFVQ